MLLGDSFASCCSKWSSSQKLEEDKIKTEKLHFIDFTSGKIWLVRWNLIDAQHIFKIFSIQFHREGNIYYNNKKNHFVKCDKAIQVKHFIFGPIIYSIRQSRVENLTEYPQCFLSMIFISNQEKISIFKCGEQQGHLCSSLVVQTENKQNNKITHRGDSMSNARGNWLCLHVSNNNKSSIMFPPLSSLQVKCVPRGLAVLIYNQYCIKSQNSLFTKRRNIPKGIELPVHF